MIWTAVVLLAPLFILAPVYLVSLLLDLLGHDGPLVGMLNYAVVTTAFVAGLYAAAGLRPTLTVSAWHVLLVPAGVALYYGENLVLARVTGGLDLAERADRSLALLPLVVVVVPVAEELLFRGAFRMVFADLSAGSFLALSSVLFGLQHSLFGKRDVAFKTAVGVVLGVVYLWTGTLVAPVVTHAAYNAGYLVVSRYPLVLD
jgi:membrane protease YdiL (CAAX protease family)